MKKSKSLKVITSAAVALLISTSCSKLSGTYECGYGQTISFNGGKMKTNMAMGLGAVETPYTLEGKEVKVEQNGVTATLYTLNENGCLVGIGGMTKCCKEGETGNAKTVETEKKEVTSEEKDKAAERAKFIQDSIAAAIASQMQ